MSCDSYSYANHPTQYLISQGDIIFSESEDNIMGLGQSDNRQ